jgi:hypothetical protein
MKSLALCRSTHRARNDPFVGHALCGIDRWCVLQDDVADLIAVRQGASYSCASRDLPKMRMDTVSVATAPAQWISGQRWSVTSRGLGTARPAAVRTFTSVHADVTSGPAAGTAEESPPGAGCPAHPASSTAASNQAATDISRFLQLLAMDSLSRDDTRHTG